MDFQTAMNKAIQAKDNSGIDVEPTLPKPETAPSGMQDPGNYSSTEI